MVDMFHMVSCNICQGRFNHSPMKFMLALKVSNHKSHDPILPFLIILISHISHILNENTMVPHLSHYSLYPHQTWIAWKNPRAMQN
jgi:hypothetical protein